MLIHNLIDNNINNKFILIITITITIKINSIIIIIIMMNKMNKITT
jgi:hypothetical protein